MRYLLTNRAWHTQTYSESPGVPWNTIPARQTRSMQLPLTHYRSKLMGEYLSINYDIPLFLCALHVIVLKCLVFIQIWSLGCIYSAISIFYQLRCDKLLFIDPFKNVIYLAIYLCVCVHVCRWVWVRWRCLWWGIIQQSKGHMTAVFEFHPHWFITLQSQTKTLHKMISRGRQLEQHSIVV